MQLLNAQFELAKARTLSERERRERVLATQERRILEAVQHFIRVSRAPVTIRVIKQLLEQGNITGAIDIVNKHIDAMGRTISQSVIQTAMGEAKVLASKVVVTKARPKTRIAVGFDPSNETAYRLIRANQLRFVQDLTNKQRDAIRIALANSYRDGTSIERAVKAFQGAIGLTPYQAQSVDNYRQLLINGSREALDRALRDKRFDMMAERSFADGGEPLTSGQIDRMVDRYQENFVRLRARTIARTEGLTAVSIARHEATMQVVDQAGFDPDSVKRGWVITKDNRVRDSHRDMEGQEVGLGEPFVTPDGVELMYPGDPTAPAEERINCRCDVVIRFG